MTDNKIPIFAEELAKANQQAEQANQGTSATPLPSDVENVTETAPYNFTEQPSVASVEASDGENSDIVVPMRPNGEEPGDANSPIVETTQPTQPNTDVDAKPKPSTPKAKPVKYPIAYTDDDLQKAYSLLTDDERQGIDLTTDAGKASMSAMVDKLKLPNRIVVGNDGKQQRVFLPYDPEDVNSEAYTQSQKPIEVIGTEGKRGGEKLGIPLAEIMDNPSSVRWQFGDTTITGMQPITGGVTQAKVKDLESASYTTDGKPILTFKTSDGQTQKVIINATKADVDKARSERNAVAEVDLRSKEALLQSRQKDIDAKLSKAMSDEGYTTPDVTQGVDEGNSLSSLVRLYLLPRINPKTAPLANAYDTNKATLDKIEAIKTNIANGNTSSGAIDDIVKSGSEVLGGFLSKVSKASTWDNGVSELSLATYGKKAYDKYMAGGKLTDDEQAMLDAIGYSLYFDEAYKDNLHNANLGAGVAESLPYAINIAIAGWTGAGKAVGNAVETSITKALKSRLLKRYGERAIARWLPSVASKATSALTEAGVATAVGGLKQEADALQRMTGDVDNSTIDASGHATYNKDSKVDSGGFAHYKAFGAGLIENLSEMAEPYIALIPKGIKSVVSNKIASLAKKNGTFNSLYDAMASLKPSQLSQVLDAGLRKGKINGLFEEVAGEVAGNIANAALIGDMSFTLDKESPEWQNSVFNPEVNADIVAQCAIMSYGFRVPGAIADATYNASKAASSVRTNIMGKKAFGDKWQDVKATIDAMSPEDAVEFASNAVKEQSDGCEAVYRYAIQAKGEQLANNIQANKDDNTNDITDVAHETAVKAVDAPIEEARQAVMVAQESSQDMPNSLKVSIDALVDNDASDGEVKSLFDQLSDAERPMAEQYYLSQVQLKGHEVGATARADAETEQFADAVSDMSTEVDGNAVVMTADVEGEQKVIKSKGDTMTILADGTAVTSDKVTDVKTSPVDVVVESHREQALQSEMDKLDFAKNHNPNTINPNSGDVVMGADGNQYVYNEATTTNSDGSQVTQTCLYPAIPSDDGGIVADTKQPLLQGISKDEVLAMQDRYYDGLDNNATQGTTRNEEATDATDTQETTESADDNTTDAETNVNDATPNDGKQTEEPVETSNEEQSIDQGVAQTDVSQEQENTQPKDVNITDASKIADTYVSKISKARASKSDSVRRNAEKLVSAFTKKAKASSNTDLGAMVSRLASQTENDTAMELLDIANNELQSRKSARRGNANVATESDNDVQERLAEAESETDTEPTEAQKKAGNYKKGHFNIDGYDVSIENPKGSVRSGTDANGKKWEQKMNNTYGYIRGTEGVDGDHIDVFFSDDPSQGDVFVVDQVNNDGTFDEHKVMYGFASEEEARKAYLSNYEDGWQGLGAITHVSKEEFKKWVESSHRKTKPFAEYKNVNAVDGNNDDTTQATESPITEEANSHLAESEQKAKERMKYLTPSQVARLMRIGKVAKSMGLGIRFVDTMEDNGLYDPNTNTITIALDAENPIEVVFGHETMHKIAENKDDYNTIRNLAIEILGEEEFNRRVDDAEKLYKKNGYNYEKSYYEEEVVCDFMGEMLNNNNLLDRICFNVNHRILSAIRDVLEKIASYFTKSDENIVRVRTIVSAAYNNEMRRAEDYKDEETIEGARKASLKRKEEVDDKSRAYFSKNDTQVTQDEFDASQKMMDRMADMMSPYIDASVKGRRVMPEEAYGSKDAKSTIFNNSSYGKTMENTLICLRTLAYNEFVDAVKTELGRPITQRESFLASQMVYDIATDPQCLYCYVSLDRKAYDEFLLRYMNQRDKVLEGFRSLGTKEKNIGKKNPHVALPNLYKEYLDGRKDTKEQKARFDMWISNEIAGIKTITASELTTSKTRKTIVEGLDKALSKQMKDAEKYAQSASWAKKEVDYISYLGELLTLNKKWIDRLTSEYGLRFYSFSEYTPAFLLENMQMVRDASLRGLRGLGYTKEIDFVKVFAPTGMNINCSCYGRLDKDGNMQMDTLQGADWEEVKELRNKYKNVGAVFVATNDESVEWALGQDWIDVVIPFHIVRTGADIAEFYGWNNYSSEQADKAKQGQKKMYISPVEHKNNKETFLEACERHGVTPRFSKWLDNPNYMKLVNETRLSVDESVNLKPVFDMESAEDSWRRFVNKGGYYNGWWKVDEKGLQESIQRVVNDIKEGNNPRDVEYGNQRIPINAEKMIQEARKKRTHGHAPIMDVFDKFGNVIPSTGINANTNVEQRKSVRKDVASETIEEETDNDTSVGELMTRYSVRKKPAPQKTKKAYKLFKVDVNGNPHALFIDKASNLEQGIWYDADCPNIESINNLDAGYTYLMDMDGVVYDKRSAESKLKAGEVKEASEKGLRWMSVTEGAKGTKLVRNVGINGSGTVSIYALRPGWHATSAPSARHIGSTDGGKEVRYRRPDERWFEIEISADNDYNDEARERYMASHPKAKRDDVYANMKGDITDKIPEDGFYNFKTNSNANPKQSWYISGSIRIVRPIGEKEAQRICDKEGVAYDLPYKDGIKNFTDNEQGLMKSAEEAVSAYKEEAERPKPLMSAILHSIRGGKRNVPIDPFVEGWDSIISSDAFKLEETSFDSLKAVEEFQRYMTGSKDVPDYLNAHRALMVLSSVNKAQMDMFEGTYVENLRKAIEEMVGTAEMNKGFYAEDGALAELDRFLKAQHGLERNRDMRVRAKLSEIYNEKIAETQIAYNQTQDKEAYNDAVKKAQDEYNATLESFYAKRDEIVAEGLEAGDNWYLINTKLDNYVIEKFFNSDKKDKRDLTLSEINALKAKRDELLERAKNEQWSARRLQEALNKMLSDESFKFITGNKKMVSLPATKEYYDELAGLTGMFSWGNTPLGVYLANEEAKQFVSWYKGTENKESLDAVEKAIADINDFSLKKQKESGLVDEDYVKEQKRRYLNFVPLRDFMDVSSDDMYDYLTGNAGVGGNPVKTAKGRQSEAGPAIAGLINVANRSITAGNRNLALQKMYNIVKAKGINTLANARNRWIVRDSEDTNKWHDAEPEIAPDATAEQVTTQLEEFENKMKDLEEKGLARRVDGKRNPSEYRIMSRTQMDEHKIKVAIGGRQYIIDFLGNPRAAQAANGMTNPDVSDDAGRTLFRTFKNFLASAFTSKNIAFSVANFFRDTEHSNNYVFIKEGGEYYRRFTERQLNKFKYRSYMKEIFSKLKMFREGKLSEDDTFYQFMNNGGATGYTFVQSQEEEAEKFVKELVEAKNGNWGKKVWNRFFDMVEYMGNVSELTNRYIAFLTSREMGRSIGRSIEDAKEVTLNFNRKGSGTKTKIDGLLPKYIPSIVEYGQRYILFFNANVQAKRQLLYMLMENPAKTTGARIGRAAFFRMMIPAIFAGVFLPAINDIVLPAIYSALGFDDDDDDEKYDYFNKLGDYERSHSINFALPNNAFLSIPVSPDIAPFMSIGDVISAQMQNKRDMTFKDFIEAGTDIISPININYGSEDDINWTASAMSFFPSQMRPIGDVFVNTNFMGQPVYKGGGIGNRQYTPEFKKGMRRTSPALTAWSKFVNDMSGGDDVEKGAMDGLFNNPAVMEHLLKGYLGGYGTATLDMVINPLYNSLTGDFEDMSLKAEQLPLVGRFYKGGSRDEQMRRMERTFRNEVYERNAETRAQESELKKEAMKANREGQLYRLAELRNKYIQLVQSDKYKKYYATKQASEAISDQLKLTSTMTDNEKRYLIDMMKRTIGIYRGEIKIYGTPSEDNQ